jgi:probable phosphoglycerate mutase
MRFTIHADGGARGNPGPAGSGAVIRNDKKKVIGEVSEFLGHATNNVAEYTAILRGLELLLTKLGADAQGAEVDVEMDSKLVVEQMKGNYKIKHPNLKPLALGVKNLLPKFKQVTFTHIPREKNKDADRLANKAMDRGAY